MRHPIITEDLAAVVTAPLDWQQLAGQRVLVTGASGFLAAYIVEVLLFLNEKRNCGIAVSALVRDLARAQQRFAAYSGRSDLEYIVQDVCLPIPAGQRFDYIIHAASPASPKYYGGDPVGTLMPNIIGTHHLLDRAVRDQSRGVLMISSSEVYGSLADDKPVAEHEFGGLDPATVRACYAESKRAAETMCVAWAKQYGIPVKIVRPFHTYGPGLRLDDGRVFADFVRDIVAGKDIRMASDGQAIRAFCYVRDAVTGFFTVLLKGGSGEAYNIGNPDGALKIIELASLLVGLFPESNLRVIQDASNQATTYVKSSVSRSVPDIAKAGLLGWWPRISVTDGFRRTILSYA